METISSQNIAVPRHVAIIMDGNGRWARARHLPRTAGHKKGVTATRRVVECCSRRGIKVLTLFAFSSENWQRPPREVQTLMELFFTTLKGEVRRLAKNNIKLRFIGERSAFSEKLQYEMQLAEQTTMKGSGMALNVAANYGGRWDITQAARRLAFDVKERRIHPDEITSDLLNRYLSTTDLIEPDLFIRTGGEQRISNFLLWQLAYTELYFTDILWPDFDEQALDQAFKSFSSRQRRFGKTGEQVSAVAQLLPNT